MKEQPEFIISKSSLLHIIGYGIAGLRLTNKFSDSKGGALRAVPLTETMLKEAEALSSAIEAGGFITIMGNNCPNEDQSTPEPKPQESPMPDIESGFNVVQSTERQPGDASRCPEEPTQ